MIPKTYIVCGWNASVLGEEVTRLERMGHHVTGIELRNDIRRYPFVEAQIIKFLEHSPVELEAWREMAKNAGGEFPEKVEMPPPPQNGKFKEPEPVVVEDGSGKEDANSYSSVEDVEKHATAFGKKYTPRKKPHDKSE